jgi:putative transposase
MALALLRANDTIHREHLQTANMLKNHHLAKSIADAGWSQFLSILAFKAVCAGRRAVAAPPALTSQICSGCGALVQKGLSIRWHTRPECGMGLHRDHNAAKTIERLGRSLQGGVAVVTPEN